MIRKYKKILFTAVLFAILMFCAFISTVNANEITLEELSEKVVETNPNTSFVYVIGEYVFTSTHILTTQDIMLAARSIEVPENSGETNKDVIYNQMSIIYLEPIYNGWDIEGFRFVSNILDETQTKGPEKYSIKYIDYDNSFNEINTNELVNEAYTTIENVTSNEKFEVAKEGTTIKVTVLENSMNSIEALEGTGIATAAENLLNEYGVNTVTLAIPGAENGVELTAENLMSKLGELKTLFTTLAGKADAEAGDLAGKSITVTIGLDEGCSAEGTTTFTVTFDKKEVEVSELVNEMYNTIDATTENNQKFEVSRETLTNKINVTILETQMDSVMALEGTGIVTAAENLLNEVGVSTVTLAIPGTENSVNVTAENLMSKIGELNTLFKTLAGTPDAVAGDLAGKSITVTINLKENYTTNDETVFTIAFN